MSCNYSEFNDKTLLTVLNEIKPFHTSDDESIDIIQQFENLK